MRNILDANVAAYTFWTLFIFLQIVANHNASFIFEEKIVRIKFINEYSFQWYQFIIVSFIDDFSRFFRFNNVVFHLRNFCKFFSMRMSQHNSSMKRQFRQIIDVKFKRRYYFYFEFSRFRIENDHQCCVKYKIFFHFFADSSRVSKSFKDFQTRFSWTMLITFIRKLIFFDVNTFNEAFSISKSSFDNFDEFEQRKLFFEKEILFFLFND
jgi:hypothetical protein